MSESKVTEKGLECLTRERQLLTIFFFGNALPNANKQ